MLWRYSSNDRKNLRKSGTEEEYSEKEQLLHEIIEKMKNEGLTIRAPRRSNNGAVPQPARGRLTSTQEAARRSAATARDAAAEAYTLEDDWDNTAVSETPSQLLNNMINGDDNASAEQQQCSQFPSTASTESTAPAASAISLRDDQGASAAPSGSISDCASPRTTARSELQRGKRKQEQADYDFLEKRMKHEMEMKNKEFVLETKRIALEESRLSWERERALLDARLKEAELEQRKEQLLQLNLMQEEMRKERAEERRFNAAQQQAVLGVLENIVTKLNNIG
ncbi:uncharacterized protein LOC142559494 [Dermacentor variabilis]|uniref:uncharacterized protein LOC142559494 n=1 Tax=Dermacentor variabilis TaxID=34621 RepID=UPI003F5B8D15